MGYIGTFGTPTTAPEHHCSTFGTPSWSGLHQDEFTPDLVHELRKFIEREAARKGNNDRVIWQRADCNEQINFIQFINCH